MITVVSYGLGNINAFCNVFKKLNIPVTLATTPDQLSGARKVILPGVGSFDYAMTMLQESGMREVLDELVIVKKIPVLGVCVGMQMLGHCSEEGKMRGLSWIDGEVRQFDRRLNGGMILPHMGWNTVIKEGENLLMDGLGDNTRFYFLHSYYFACRNNDDSVATTDYGIRFTSMVNNKNIFGIQFHPEKSHLAGIRVLSNFAKL
jgi:imidazole glycerol-phosphate synthase subunit HisH